MESTRTTSRGRRITAGLALAATATGLTLVTLVAPAPFHSRAAAQGAQGSAASSGGWKVEKQDGGIVISSRSREGSSYNEVRGVAEFDAPPEAFIPIFRDAEGYKSWLAECKESGSVGTRQGPNDFHLYAVIGIPWPFEDRDTVVKAKLRKLAGDRGFAVFLKSMNDELVPARKGLVRMKSLEGRWILEALPGGRTKAEFRIFLEPAGSLTPVFVNTTAASIQLKTLKNVADRLKKMGKGQPAGEVPELGPLDPSADP